MSGPTVTVVTAAWRAENMPRVLAALEAQTFTNWHHIIVNDNSETVRAWLQENDYFAADPRRHVVDLHVRTHWFGAYARDIGALIAFTYFKGSERQADQEYICFFDDDNNWLPEHLETLVGGFQERPDAVMVGVDMAKRCIPDPTYRHVMRCAVKPQNCDLGSFLYRKWLFDKYGYFLGRAERRITFDWELIQKMALGEGEDKVHIIHKPTFEFFHRELRRPITNDHVDGRDNSEVQPAGPGEEVHPVGA